LAAGCVWGAAGAAVVRFGVVTVGGVLAAGLPGRRPDVGAACGRDPEAGGEDNVLLEAPAFAIKASVAGTAMPVAARPCDAWKRLTAPMVFVP